MSSLPYHTMKKHIFNLNNASMVRMLKPEADYIRNTAIEHNKYFENSIPLIASENIISPLVQEIMISDLHGRYAEGTPGERYYQGNQYVDQIENKAIDLAKQLFKCEYADVRPISGTVANLAVLFALTKPGDTITTCNVADGAHISTAVFGAVGVRGVNPVPYPFDVENMNLDLDGTRKTILETKPKLSLFGRSVFLFPPPLKELQDVFQEVDCPIWYDAAHVLGLIGGGRFQDPLREGVHVITASTHKTFPGPQHGIIMANPKEDKMRSKLKYGVFPGVLSNHHLHTMAGLAIALTEHIEFGAQYADQIIRNAKALGQALYERGFGVLCPHLGFTESHTLAIDVSKLGGGAPAVEAMEAANMVANKNLLPWDDVDIALNPSGIRVGTQEVTRLGMKEKEMEQIAEFMKRLIVDKESPDKVRPDVVEFKKDFQKVLFCFHEGKNPYEYHKLV